MKSKSNSIILAILLLVLIFQAAHAQKEGQDLIDSLFAELPKLTEDTNKVKTLAQLSFELADFDLEKGVEVGNQALKLAEDLDYDFGIAMSNLSLSYNYFYQSQWHLSLETALVAERIFKDIKDYDRLCASYCLLCQTTNRFDIENGREYYIKAKSLVVKHKDSKWQQKNLSWLENLSPLFEPPDSTYQLVIQYQRLAKSSKSDLSLARGYMSSVNYYKSKSDIDSALFFLHQALPIYLKLHRKRILAAVYIELGRLYNEKRKDPDSGLIYLGRAEECFKHAITISEEYGDPMMTYSGYYQLYLLYKDQGQTEQALSSLEQFWEIYRNWVNPNDASKMAAIAYKYEIELNKKELEYLDIQNRRRLTVIIAGTTGVILLFLLISLLIIIWRRNLILKRREMEHQLVTLEQKALQSMMNPHFIFNALGSIQNYLLQNKPGEAGLYLSQFARLIRQNISGIHSAMISLEEEIDRLKNYLDLERLRMENKFEYEFHLDENVEEDAVQIPTMIIQPFVENAILHGISALDKDGLIDISFIMHSEKTIKIIIEDNGIGIRQSRIYASNNEPHLHMSMEMTRKRIEILGRKFKVQTSLEISDVSPGSHNPGTRIAIVLPVSYGEADFQ